MPSRGSWVHNTRTRSQVVTSLRASEGPHLGKMGTQSLPYPSVSNAHHGERIGVAAYPLTSRWAHMCVEWLHHPCLLGAASLPSPGVPNAHHGDKIKVGCSPIDLSVAPHVHGIGTSPKPSGSSYITHAFLEFLYPWNGDKITICRYIPYCLKGVEGAIVGKRVATAVPSCGSRVFNTRTRS